MNFESLPGGQFASARGGQFGSAKGGHIKSAGGGQVDRRLQLPAGFNKISWVLKSTKSKELNKKELLRLFFFLKENRFINAVTDAELYDTINNCFATGEGEDINIKSRNKPDPTEKSTFKLDLKKLLLPNS